MQTNVPTMMDNMNQADGSMATMNSAMDNQQTTLPMCTNTSKDLGTADMQMCMCPIIPQIQEFDASSNTWYCK